jgi:NAD(P)-dependent dehydrogenase (short-subunit alcohol dehydrogenase family)
VAEPKLVIILGVGVGLGTSLAKRFAQGGHPIALAARKPDIIVPLASELEQSGAKARAYSVNASNPQEMAMLFDDAEAALGPIGCVISNVSHRVQKPFLQITAEEFERTLYVNGMCAYLAVHEAARRMVPRGEGSIFFTGGRTSTRPRANLTSFGFVKAGIRNFIAAAHIELGPKGIHFAHFNIDGGIDNPRTRERDPHLVENDGLIATDAIAELYYQTHLQPRSCWSLDVECRPWIEPL